MRLLDPTDTLVEGGPVMKRLSVPLLAITMALGCAATQMGKDFDITKKDQIVKGQTTKEEVRSWFGEPTGVYEVADGEMWAYQYDYVFTKSEGKNLYITFDKEGKVKSVSHHNIKGSGW
jgi:outer membrane protein assembly factor BamE (lipoprotein component of BamABCDE complex)